MDVVRLFVFFYIVIRERVEYGIEVEREVKRFRNFRVFLGELVNFIVFDEYNVFGIMFLLVGMLLCIMSSYLGRLCVMIYS